MSLTMNYVFLLIAVCLEVVATTALSRSNSFHNLVPSLICLVCYGVSSWLISYPLKTMPTGIVYATWSGIGIIFIAGIAWLRYGQKLDFPALLGLGLIITGCIIANGFSKTIRN